MVITEYCTGCRLCEQLCPHKAINIQQNNEGFLLAFVDDEKCVECNLCQKKCPQNSDVKKGEVGSAYAIRLKDDEVLSNSASGGAFIGLARAFVQDGGYVAGVVYDNNWKAVFNITNETNGLEPMQSSKYLQADTSNIYSIIKGKLQEGQKVLFAGTACQVAGLKGFLNKEYENLYTIDLICHGVTSPLMFQLYIKWLEQRKQSKILSYNFRTKQKGWGLFYSYSYSNKKISNPMYVDPYYKVFLKGDAYRECCYDCRYASLERISDITIGDYWGIEQEHPSFYSSKGVSSILINTNKGKVFFDNVMSDFYVIETKPQSIAKHNENLQRPTHRNQIEREHFYDGILTDENWFDKVAKKYKPAFLDLVKARIPNKLRVLLSKILTNR